MSDILAVKRYGPLRRGRYQRRYPTLEAAKAAAERWIEEPDVKAIWVFDTDDSLALHKTKRDGVITEATR